MYYSQEHQSFGTLTSFVDLFIDGEETEVFIPRDDSKMDVSNLKGIQKM